MALWITFTQSSSKRALQISDLREARRPIAVAIGRSGPPKPEQGFGRTKRLNARAALPQAKAFENVPKRLFKSIGKIKIDYYVWIF